MQYKVPQNVDIEDRVIGNLSLRQFLVILIGLGILIVLYFILQGPLRILFWLLAIIIGTATFAFAFVKYGDQKLEVFVMSAFKTFSNPRQRVWKKEVTLSNIPEPVAKAEPAKKDQKKNLGEAKNDLETLAHLIDSGGYSKLESKDRIMGGNDVIGDNAGATDIIAAAETSDTALEKMIEAAGTQAAQKEPLVSDTASLKPGQDFDYPKIQLANDDFLKDLKIKKF